MLVSVLASILTSDQLKRVYSHHCVTLEVFPITLNYQLAKADGK